MSWWKRIRCVFSDNFSFKIKCSLCKSVFIYLCNYFAIFILPPCFYVLAACFFGLGEGLKICEGLDKNKNHKETNCESSLFFIRFFVFNLFPLEWIFTLLLLRSASSIVVLDYQMYRKERQVSGALQKGKE